MARNYEVFNDGKRIIFQSKEEKNQLSVASVYEHLEKLIADLFANKLPAIALVLSDNPEESLSEFAAHFKWIEAAGGVVSKGQDLLFIKRFGKWDLPKGKIEPNENVLVAAQREIEEECNLVQLIHHGHLIDTFHMYKMSNKTVLKKTHWFHFSLPETDEQKTIPQTEEGIEEIRWIHREDLQQVYDNTYENIKIVLEEFGQISKWNIPSKI